MSERPTLEEFGWTHGRVPAEAFPPGDLIREEIAARGMTREQLRVASGIEAARLDEILDQPCRLEGEEPERFEWALGIDAQFFRTTSRYWEAWLYNMGEELEWRAWRKEADATPEQQSPEPTSGPREGEP